MHRATILRAKTQRSCHGLQRGANFTSLPTLQCSKTFCKIGQILQTFALCQHCKQLFLQDGANLASCNFARWVFARRFRCTTVHTVQNSFYNSWQSLRRQYKWICCVLISGLIWVHYLLYLAGKGFFLRAGYEQCSQTLSIQLYTVQTWSLTGLSTICKYFGCHKITVHKNGLGSVFAETWQRCYCFWFGCLYVEFWRNVFFSFKFNSFCPWNFWHIKLTAAQLPIYFFKLLGKKKCCAICACIISQIRILRAEQTHSIFLCSFNFFIFAFWFVCCCLLHPNSFWNVFLLKKIQCNHLTKNCFFWFMERALFHFVSFLISIDSSKFHFFLKKGNSGISAVSFRLCLFIFDDIVRLFSVDKLLLAWFLISISHWLSGCWGVGDEFLQKYIKKQNHFIR